MELYTDFKLLATIISKCGNCDKLALWLMYSLNWLSYLKVTSWCSGQYLSVLQLYRLDSNNLLTILDVHTVHTLSVSITPL